MLLTLALVGCRPAPLSRDPAADSNLRSSIVLAVGINNDFRINAALLQDVNQRIGDLIRGYRSVHPGVRVEIILFEEDRLAQELERRSQDGLAPDLLLVNGSTALTLAQKGVIRPLQFPASVTEQLEPGSLARASLPDGRLIGLPLQIEPQLACFDLRRVAEPPATLAELLARNGGRIQVGLPIDAINLAWTLGPLGTLPTVKALASGKPETVADRARLQAWLEWLASAHLQQGIHFLGDQDELLEGLISGRLHWISCRSTHLARLRQRLGHHLGVSVLPSGPGGPASPVNRERALVFGINSTPRQQQAAESLARFSINPLVQRTITLGSLASLPANRSLLPLLGSSRILDTLLEAQEQGTTSEDGTLALLHTDARGAGRFRTLITRFLYGEIKAREAAGELARALARRELP